jgi:hypothetical protein
VAGSVSVGRLRRARRPGGEAVASDASRAAEPLARLGLPPSIDQALRGGLLFSALWAHLGRPVTRPAAQRALQTRLERRANDFLALLRRAVFAYPDSTYCQLLRLAGCEYGDLERLVEQEGVEGSLARLLRGGVYITVDELMGPADGGLVRGSARVATPPGWTRNPALWAGAGWPYLATLRDLAINGALLTETWARAGGLEAVQPASFRWAYWGVPGDTALFSLIRAYTEGSRPARWFSQVELDRPGLPWRDRSSAHGLAWTARLAGRVLPGPEYVPLDGPLPDGPIARWLAAERRAGKVPVLHTTVSAAVGLARAGLELAGVWLLVGGEPLTARRRALLDRSGARIVPIYASSESGQIASGCLAPAAADDLHLQEDLHALIRPGAGPTPLGLRPDALLLTTLRAAWPRLLLNVSLGDAAEVVERRCGCPLERPGWTRQLRAVHSYAKLTAGGLAFPDRRVIRILEEVLPARFGGGPTDYQLVEEEAESDGQPRLRLLVDPSVGELPEAAVGEALLSALRHSGEDTESGPESELLWRQAGWPRLERRRPLVSNGKVLHLVRRA